MAARKNNYKIKIQFKKKKNPAPYNTILAPSLLLLLAIRTNLDARRLANELADLSIQQELP